MGLSIKSRLTIAVARHDLVQHITGLLNQHVFAGQAIADMVARVLPQRVAIHHLVHRPALCSHLHGSDLAVPEGDLTTQDPQDQLKSMRDT